MTFPSVIFLSLWNILTWWYLFSWSLSHMVAISKASTSTLIFLYSISFVFHFLLIFNVRGNFYKDTFTYSCEMQRVRDIYMCSINIIRLSREREWETERQIYCWLSPLHDLRPELGWSEARSWELLWGLLCGCRCSWVESWIASRTFEI